MKKIAVIIASMLLCAVILPACKNGDDATGVGVTTESGQTQSSDSIVNETTQVFDDRLNVDDGIGEYNFNGAEFTVVVSSDQMNEPYFAETELASPINDAVYYRTKNIEERFNIKLMHKDTGGVWDEVAKAIRTDVMAGTQQYDLGVAHTFIGLTGLVSEGMLYDWNKLPVVDMNRPWWNKNIKDTLTIDGKLYVAASDYIYQRPAVIYFNKQLIRDYSLDNPYELVKSGKWTWDKLAEMAAAVSKDLDGDGAFTDADQYGYSHLLGWQTITVIHSVGMYLTEQDDAGYPRYTPFYSDKMREISDKYYDLIYSGNKSFLTVYDPSDGALNGYTPMFGAGQILFLHSNTELLQKFVDLNMDFGMIPLPKYNEAQKGYYSMADTQMLVVPSSVKNPEMAGVIAEALSVESYKTVVPAVYDVMYANRYLRDEESYEMFNLIMDGLVYEFSWTFGEGSNMSYALPNLMTQKSRDLTSYVEKNVNQAEKALVKFIDTARAMDS